MRLFDKFFKKKSVLEKSPTKISKKNFILLNDAVSVKTTVTKWIRKQNSQPGSLLWFVLPSNKNQYYQPCFGIFADTVLYNKLERAEYFNLNCSISNTPLSFSWSVTFQDPDNSGNQITLSTSPIEADESSLTKLSYVAEQVQVHYFFYACAESSNFVWMEMDSGYNEKLSQFYLSLKNKQTDISNALEKETSKQKSTVVHIGPKTPRPIVTSIQLSKSVKMSIPQISDSSITLGDGTIIQLEDIKEMSDCGLVIGAPNHPLMRAINSELEKGHGVIYLLFINNNRPSTAVIPVENHSKAVEIIEQIKKAKELIHKQKSKKIIVGECSKCHRKIQVNEHVIKPKMKLTCKCGNVNVIDAPNLQKEN